MASLLFDAETVTPALPMGPIPEGSYLVAIQESEVKPTKSGNGEYLALTMEVLEGEFKGRKVFDNLNIKNPNAEATKIAKQNLSAICHAVNVLKFRDSIQIHGLPFMVVVKLESYTKPTGERVMKNVIKGYKSKHHTEPVPGMAQPMQQPAASAPAYAQPAMMQQPAAAGSPPPWGAQA